MTPGQDRYRRYILASGALLTLAACAGHAPTSSSSVNTHGGTLLGGGSAKPETAELGESAAPIEVQASSPALVVPSPTATPTTAATGTPTPQPTPVASIAPALKAALDSHLDELKSKLEAIAQVGFGGLTIASLQVSVADANQKLIGNNGSSLLSNNGGGILANNGGGFRLLDDAPSTPTVTLAAAAGELATGVVLWPNGDSLYQYPQTSNKALGRAVYVDAQGKPFAETDTSNQTKDAAGNIVSDVLEVYFLPPTETFGELLNGESTVTPQAAPIAEHGNAEFHDPVSGLDIVFDSYQLDYVQKTGAYTRHFAPYGLKEQGTFQGSFTYFPFNDPLVGLAGQAQITTSTGQPLYNRAQTLSTDGHITTATYDLLDGFKLVFALDDRVSAPAPGTVNYNGENVGAATREQPGDGTLKFTLTLTGEAQPIVVQLGTSGQGSAPTPPPANAPLPFDLVVPVVGTPGVVGQADGDGPQASFNYPDAVAMGDDHTMYVADELNNRIRVLTEIANSPQDAWHCATFIGSTAGNMDGPATTATLSDPRGLAVCTTVKPNDTLLVGAGGCVRAIRLDDPTHPMITLAGDGTTGYQDGAGTSARFSKASGLAVGDDGTIYVADQGNACIRTIRRPAGTWATDGVVVGTLAGSAGSPGNADGDGLAATFTTPVGVAFDAGRKSLWVADRDGYCVREIDLSQAGHAPVRTVVGPGDGGLEDGSVSTASLGVPSGIALLSSGKVVISDWKADRLRTIDVDGNVRSVAGEDVGGGLFGMAVRTVLGKPWGVAVFPDGGLAVADSGAERVLVLYRAGSSAHVPSF